MGIIILRWAYITFLEIRAKFCSKWRGFQVFLEILMFLWAYHSISPGGYSLDFIYTKKTELVSKTHLDRPPRPQIDRGYFINMFPTIFRPHEFNIPDTRSETPPDSPKFVPKSGPVSLRSSLSARKIMGFDLFHLPRQDSGPGRAVLSYWCYSFAQLF